MKIFKQVLFSLLVLICFFGSVEILLRLSGFRFQRSLSYLQFGYPNPTELHQVFIPDEQLLFRLKPGYDFGEGFEPLNAQGFRGKNFEPEKPAGVCRIVCLGDSVTFGTAEGSYPEMLEQILGQTFPKRKIQVYNFGVPGYSSFQGKNLLEQVLREYQPDLVVIFYGWNDHWLARGFSDSEQKIPKELRLIEFRDQLSQLRIYQLLNKVVSQIFQRISHLPTEKFRVPLSEYHQNLSLMINQARSHGVKIILATAPAGFGLAPLPDFLEALGFVKDDSQLEAIHQQYNQIVRKLAKEFGVPLVDLDLIFKEYGVKNFFDRPEKDIIHPNRAGLNLIAQAIAEQVRKIMETQIQEREDEQ